MNLVPWAGAVLVAAGVAAIYWPASLIVTGLLAMRLAGVARAERERRRREAVAAEERRTAMDRGRAAQPRPPSAAVLK